MKENEEVAVRNYQAILDECLASYGKDDRAVILLGQIVWEEKGHAKMVETLINICQRTHPEWKALS